MLVQGDTSNDLRNALLAAKGTVLEKCFAVNAATVLRSNIQDVFWNAPSAGVMNLHPTSNPNNRVTLTINSGSDGANAIRFIDLTSPDLEGPDVKLLRIQLPQDEEFPNGGQLIITKIEHRVTDKSV